MGAGKTTFARALIEGLGVVQPPEGSPTFAIAHEYVSPRGDVVHIDFYRIKNEAEIEDAGLTSYFWEREALVLAEWTSLWPAFRDALLKDAENQVARTWQVLLAMNGDRRDAVISVFKTPDSVRRAKPGSTAKRTKARS